MKPSILVLMAGAAALLAGCGGSPSVEVTPPPVQQPTDQVPPSATASSAALVDFLKSLASSDSAEPLKVGTLMPPTTETEEPRPL